MTLSPADIKAIAVAVVNELDSRRRSQAGSGARGQGDRCDEKDEIEFMDPTSTATAGESSSAEQIAARLLSRTRQRPKPRTLRLQLARRPKASSYGDMFCTFCGLLLRRSKVGRHAAFIGLSDRHAVECALKHLAFGLVPAQPDVRLLPAEYVVGSEEP